MADEAQQWWQALVANDEGTVCEAVNTAFSDNPAAGCAVGVDGSVPSVVMRQQDLDSMPTQTAGLTPGVRPTLKNLTKRDRLLWWLTAMGSNVVATLKEDFATAPGITAIDLAVLTRLPDTQRLGFVAYGRWTRQAIEGTPWRNAEDATSARAAPSASVTRQLRTSSTPARSSSGSRGMATTPSMAGSGRPLRLVTTTRPVAGADFGCLTGVVDDESVASGGDSAEERGSLAQIRLPSSKSAQR